MEDLCVPASRLRVRLHPLDALLTGGRVDGLELILLAADLNSSERVRNEGVDEVREGREVVPA